MKSDAISENDRQFYLERALAAADWFVNSQENDLPAWDANIGRFLYYYYMPEGKSVYGIVWTHGRALFVLAEAHRITGEKRYLDCAATIVDQRGHKPREGWLFNQQTGVLGKRPLRMTLQQSREYRLCSRVIARCYQ